MREKNTNIHVSRIRFGILFLLACAVCMTLSSFYRSSSKAQNPSTETLSKIAPPKSDKLGEAFSRLISIAQEKGSVPVIIGLKIDFKPIGELNNQERSIQGVNIKQAQNDLLNRLKFHKITEIKQFEYIPFLAAVVDKESLQKIRDDPQISSVEKDEDDLPTLAQSVPVVGAPSAWSSGYSGSGWAIAILDSGVDKNHSFLSGKVVSEACYSTNDAASAISSVCPGGLSQSTATNSGLNCSLSIDGCDHGTHVAGIAAGRSSSFNGVAKDGNIVAIQVFSRYDSQADCGSDPVPCTRSRVSNQISGLERVLFLSNSMNIAAVNMSLGSGQYFANCDSEQASRKTAIDSLRSVGIATVIASGNNSYTNAISAPACISSAVSVGSTGDGSNGATLDVVRDSSNSSSFLNLLAPGAVINSSVPGGSFDNKTGTSMAAPHVAGAWAVLKQRVPTASVTQILNALTSTGQAITDLRNGIVKPRIKVDAALQTFGGGNCNYTLSPTSRNFTASSNSSSVNVTTQSGCNWSATVNAPALFESIFTNQKVDIFSPFDENMPERGTTDVQVTPTSVFLNQNPITISSSGAGVPYPSTIPVSGQSGTVIKVTVALNTVTHNFADDVGVLLVGPTGVKVRLMTDVGGSGNFSATDIQFDDTAPSIPDNPTTNFASGIYKPTQGTNFNATGSNLHSTNFPLPAPASPYSLTLSSFNGQNPNGTWRLYVDDDSTGDAGEIAGGWALGITTSGSGTNWINITSGSSGTGNGTVNYSVAANTGTSQRTGTITVNGQVHTVTQSGTGSNCTYSISSSSNDVGLGSGSVNFSIDAPAGCAWEATSDSTSWLNTSSSGSGDGTVNYTYNANGSTTTPRTGRITVGGKVHTVNQIGLGGAGNVQFSATMQMANEDVGEATVTVTRAGGTGTGTVNYSTLDGTATAGSDYVSTSGNLIFLGNQTSRTFNVTILDDTAFEGNEIINLSLTNPSASVTIGNPNSATLMITDNDNSPVINRKFDFDGDGRSDISVFRPSNGVWYIQQSAAGFVGDNFGTSSDLITPADYDGDGKTDVAVFRPLNGTWYLQRSLQGFIGITFGASGDIPIPADYDGDGKADLAVFRPSNGVWYIQQSTAGFVGVAFGANGDRPVAADYDGDGKADIAVFRPSNGVWYLQRSQLGFIGTVFGANGDKPAPADYDGDNKTDVAVFRPSNGTWYLQQSTAGFGGYAFGISGDMPVAADYDGDSRADIAVFRPSNGVWYLQRSAQGFTGILFGTNGDKPISNAFIP